MKSKIDEILEIIKDNLFVNDMNWKERAEENINLASKIRELITQGFLDKTKEDRQKQVDIINFLDFHKL